MDFKERHKKNCKIENCPVCKKLDNMPPSAQGDLPKLLVKLPPDGKPKTQARFVIASTERLWNQASNYQRLNALELAITKELAMEFVSMSKLTWKELPSWNLRKELCQTNVDRILAGKTEEEWNDFRKKHIILRQESSNLYRDDA